MLTGLRKYGRISITISASTSIGTGDNATSSPVEGRTFEDREWICLNYIVSDYGHYVHNSFMVLTFQVHQHLHKMLLLWWSTQHQYLCIGIHLLLIIKMVSSPAILWSSIILTELSATVKLMSLTKCWIWRICRNLKYMMYK